MKTRNSFKLQDGRTLEGYLKEDAKEGNSKVTSAIFLTNESRELKRIEEWKQQKLFMNNAFLFLANRERILNDSRMFLTPLPYSNSLLGIYIEWWLNNGYAVEFDKEDGAMSLICYLVGSPFSGRNSSHIVYENGKIEKSSTDSFYSLRHQFEKLRHRYYEPKQLFKAYTLQEVIDILKEETTDEFYKKSLDDAYYRARTQRLLLEMSTLNNKCKTLETDSNVYESKWHAALIHSRLDDVKSFYDRYLQKKEDNYKKRLELNKEKRDLKYRFNNGELTNKEFQPVVLRIKEEKNNLPTDMNNFINKELVSLFPEMKQYELKNVAHNYYGHDDDSYIQYRQKKIIKEIIEAVTNVQEQ